MLTPVIVQEHPLKAEVKKRRLQYWWLRKALGGCPSESLLCRYLNGVDPMPEEVESGLRHILAELKKPTATTK